MHLGAFSSEGMFFAVAAEIKGKSTGRIRLKHIKGREGSEIQGLMAEAIAPGATIISDRHKSYPTIVERGFTC